MEEQASGFLLAWHSFMENGAYILVALAVVIYIITKVRLNSFKEWKQKYDFTSKYESKLIGRAHV